LSILTLSFLLIYQQLNAIENANLNSETMAAMRQGAQALRDIHGNLYVTKVVLTYTRWLLSCVVTLIIGILFDVPAQDPVLIVLSNLQDD
jgi:hypothetical protein